jgi:hypothetical protein
MKKILIYACLIAFCQLSFLGCKKQQPLEAADLAAPVRLEIKGLILVDTLQFLLYGKVIGQGIDGTISISERLYQPGQKVQVRKKADSKQIGEILVAGSPFKQVKKIFYDGVTFTDKIDLTPVSDPNNMGIRVNFSTTFGAFYGGPVDIELFVRKIDNETGAILSYTNIKVIKNVTNTFSEFVELTPIETTDAYFFQYVFKVYKAGTKELPYTDQVNLKNVDPDNIYGYIENFIPGDSQLLSISPTSEDNLTILGDSYAVQDYSSAFK